MKASPNVATAKKRSARPIKGSVPIKGNGALVTPHEEGLDRRALLVRRACRAGAVVGEGRHQERAGDQADRDGAGEEEAGAVRVAHARNNERRRRGSSRPG